MFRAESDVRYLECPLITCPPFRNIYEILTRIRPVKRKLSANQRCLPFRVSANWREYCIFWWIFRQLIFCAYLVIIINYLLECLEVDRTFLIFTTDIPQFHLISNLNNKCFEYLFYQTICGWVVWVTLGWVINFTHTI